MTEKNTCILCRQKKKNFNEEHVFPATIGGEFIITTVCVQCNSDLGRLIDTPFNNHPLVLLNRHKLGMSRDGRPIKNPVKKQTAPDGRTYEVQITKSELKAKFPPQFVLKENKEGSALQGVLSTEYIPCPVAAAEMFMSKVHREYGVQPTGYDIERSAEPPLTATVIAKDIDLIWGFMKISYEAAITFIPEYFDDPLAIKYSKMLHLRELDSSLIQYVNPVDEIFKDIIGVINSIQGLDFYTSLVILYQHPLYGLCSVVRIFECTPYCLILSDKENHLDDRKLLLLNDGINKFFQCAVIKKPSSYTFTFYSEHMTNEHITEITASNFTPDIFKYENGTVPLYNKEGECLIDSIDKLIQRPWDIKEYEKLAPMPSIIFELPRDLYLRSTNTRLLYEVSTIVFNLTEN